MLPSSPFSLSPRLFLDLFAYSPTMGTSLFLVVSLVCARGTTIDLLLSPQLHTLRNSTQLVDCSSLQVPSAIPMSDNSNGCEVPIGPAVKGRQDLLALLAEQEKSIPVKNLVREFLTPTRSRPASRATTPATGHRPDRPASPAGDADSRPTSAAVSPPAAAAPEAPAPPAAPPAPPAPRSKLEVALNQALTELRATAALSVEERRLLDELLSIPLPPRTEAALIPVHVGGQHKPHAMGLFGPPVLKGPDPKPAPTPQLKVSINSPYVQLLENVYLIDPSPGYIWNIGFQNADIDADGQIEIVQCQNVVGGNFSALTYKHQNGHMSLVSNSLAWSTMASDFAPLGVAMGYFYPNNGVWSTAQKAQLITFGINHYYDGKPQQKIPCLAMYTWDWNGSGWIATYGGADRMGLDQIPLYNGRTTKMATLAPPNDIRKGQYLVTAPHDGAFPPILWWWVLGIGATQPSRTTGFPIGWQNRPNILEVIVTDIDGDGYEEVVYLWNSNGCLGFDIYKHNGDNQYPRLELKKSFVETRAPGGAAGSMPQSNGTGFYTGNFLPATSTSGGKQILQFWANCTERSPYALAYNLFSFDSNLGYTLYQSPDIGVNYHYFAMQVADLDGDGRDEVYMLGNCNNRLWLNVFCHAGGNQALGLNYGEAFTSPYQVDYVVGGFLCKDRTPATKQQLVQLTTEGGVLKSWLYALV
jgi:hypothetical protein